jgi:UDP-3-O-[3-hydroxymyristoyl] glucosamine N-acyltransferase
MTLTQLLELFSAFIESVEGSAGPADIARVNALEVAAEDEFSFLSNPKYRADLQRTKAGVVAIRRKDFDALDAATQAARAYLVCRDPYLLFARVAQSLHLQMRPAPGIAASASVDPAAHVDPSASIGAGAVIEAGARIGADVVVSALCTVGRDTVLEAGVWLYPRVSIYHGCTIGARTIIHSGAVIGADGFGYANDAGRWVKIPQTGGVRIGTDCEVGANTTIDRGAIQDTVIGNGVKLDNQIQIAHNVTIGDDSALAGCVGVAGSAVIGKRVQIAGAANILGHLSIADGTVISVASVVTSSIDKPGFYSGTWPVQPHEDWEKSAVLVRRLDKMRDELRSLRHELAALKNPPGAQ